MKLSFIITFTAFVLHYPFAGVPHAAQQQWSPALSTVIQDANKEGKLRLSWGEGTLGGTKRMGMYEQMMNKMFEYGKSDRHRVSGRPTGGE
jgi:hypothetical protein